MNKIFKVIWSKSKQCYVVVSEIAKNKTGKKKIVVAGIFAALAMVSSVQDVSAVTGSGRTNNFSNSGSGASFQEGEGLAIGTNATVANGNTNTVAIGVSSEARGSSSFAASGGTTAAGKAGQVAIGWSSTDGTGAVAIGGTTDTAGVRDTRAIGTSAVALGVKSAANGNNAFAASGGNATGESATAIGSSAIASGRGGVAVGWNAESAVNAVGIGFKAKAKANNTVAIGVEANSDNSIGDNSSSVSIGVATRARAVGSMAMGVSADASGKYSIALGSGDVHSDYTANVKYPKATGEKAIAIGYNSNASDANAIAIGSNTLAKDAESIAVGTSNTTAYRGGVALGRNAKAENTAINNVAIGIDVTAGANTNGTADGEAVAVGRNAKANSFRTVAIGSDVSATGSTAVAMGRSANVSNNYGVAVGARVEAGNYGVALGYQAKSTASGALAIGAGNDDTKVMATATTASGGNSVAIGTSAKASIANAVALGSDSTTATNATNQSSATINSITYNFAGATSDTGMQVSVGAAGKERQIKNVAAGEVSATSTDAINGSQLFAVASQIKPVNYFSVKSTAAGNKNNDGATGVNAIAIGPDATATSAQSIALGKSASASGTDSIAIGNGSTAANKVAPVAIGQGAKANGDFSVALGGGNHQFVGAIANGVGSTALGTTSNTADGQNYQTVVGFGANTNKAEATAIGYKATVTVEGGVALGANSSSSTGRTVGYNPNDGRTNTYSALTGNVIRSTTGAIAVGNGSTVTRQITGVAAGTNDTDAVNVAQLKSVNLAFKGNVGSGDVNLATDDSDKKLTIQGDRTYITTNASGNTLTISANKKDINVTNGTARADAGVADAKNVAEAINKAVSQNAYNWYLTADNDTAGSRATINKEGTVKFSGDSNITVARNGNTITTSLNKAITVDSVKANKTITVGTNKITLDGNTGAVTGKAFNGDSFTAGNNVLSNTTLQIGSPTGGNNVSITRDGLTAKAGTKTVKFGTNGIDAGDQQITHVSSGGNVGTNAANITDVKNAVSDVTLKLDTNAKTGNVKLGEGPLKVIGANGIRTDLVGTNNGSLVVGLDSNTVNATTKGIGLTGDTGSTGLKYLKDGDASFKLAGDGNLVTTKASATGVQVAVDTAKVKDLAVEAVTVSKATNIPDNPITVTPKAGTNSKEYAIGIDTTKLAAKTHLAYTANGGTAKTVSLAKGLNFVNGTNTVATVDSDGKVSFDINKDTKDSINKSATAVGRTITLNADSGTGSSQSLSNGNVSFAVSGATGDYISTTMDGSAVKVSTKRATINSDANTGAASVTGADGLATAKNVASAINSAVNGLSQNLNISDGTNNSSVVLKNQKLTITGAGAAKATVNGQTITIDVAKGTLTANANGTATGTAGVADASDVASAINNTNTVLGNKITKNAQDIATNTSNITANKNQIITNTTNIATNTTNIAHTIALADDKGTSTTAKSLKDGNVSFNIKGDNQFISTAASGNDVTLTVNEQAIKDAAKSASSFKVKANTHAEEEVKGGDTIAFNNGDNIEISQTGKTFTIGTAKNITVDSVTAGNTVINTSGLTNGTTAITGTGITTDKVTVGGISIDKTAGINAGNKVISNVDSGGTTLTNAANIGDVQNAVANLSQNLNITDGANNGTVNLKNQKLNVAGANGVTATVNNQTITVGLDADTVNATTKGIGLIADTGSTGNKYLKDGDVSFAVTGDGSLVSTSATAAGVKVAVNSASITAGADGTITGPTKDGVATAKNVADAINAAKKASKTEITANTGEAANATKGNVTLTSTTAADGHTIYDVKLNDKVILGTGANAVTVDGTTGAITGKTATIGGVTVNGTANTIGGLSNTTWNGTAVSGRAATEDQLKAATGATTLKFTGDVATNTGSVNLKDDTFGIKGDGKYISTDVNGKNVNLTVSEAEVKKSAVAAVTVSTDTTDANNPLTVTPTTSADGTTKDYKVTIDGTKIANKTNLSYKANDGTAKQVSLADGLNFKNGTLTTASIDDNGVVKYDVNTASITAGADGTITGPTTDGVATAQNVVDAINAAKKASKTEITANTGEAANATTGNVTLTSTTAADGHTIYDVKLNDKVTLGSGANAVTVDGTAAKVTAGVTTVDGATGTITTGGTNSIKVDGATGTVTGLTNKDWTPGVTKAVTGRAATEDQLQKVADAASSQTWNITADKAGTTGSQTGTKKNATVGKDETVELVAGDNLTINQNERKFTYSLNKDLANLTSVSVGTGTTETIKLDGATGKITAKNAVIGGVTVDGDNNHVTGLSNTTWNGTATTGRAATEDQLKAVAETAKTTTDAVNLKFTGDTNTSPGVVNLKDDTFGIVGDGKYVSTDANGKNLTVKVSEAEVKKSAVAAVTVSTDTTDANNPLTVTPTTSADGTTKDYKVTIDGTKIANKTNLSYKANDGTAKQVSLADGLNFKNGTLTTASIDDAGVVKYDVNTAAITAGADGTITGPTTDGVATAQNVADAINAAKKASKTEITANTGEAANATTGNVTLTSTTAADGHTIYDVKLNDKVTLGSGANAVTIDGTAGKATIGSSVINGVNNTFTTGGAKAVTLDGSTGTITGTTANIGGVTVNGTANTIGGLSNTTWNGTATTGRAATEDQLKAVADAAGSQTWEITADKKAGTSGAQTGTKENAKVGKDDKVSLIAGENLTVDQAGKNFTYSLNKDLVKMNSATFLGTGTNTTVITGDSITQTAGTQTNTSTAGGNTVADGTKSTGTTAAGQVIKDGAKSNKSTVDSNVVDDGNGNVNTSNATSNTITDGTNRSSITAGKATIGSSVINGVNNTFTTGGANAVKLDGAAGTIKTGTVTVTGGTTNDITGLSNTTVTSADFATKGRAATEEQLKAVGEQTWQITADKDTATSGAQTGTKKDAKVGKDDKVQLIAGENMAVNQNERDFTFTLNKDLVKMNSATFLGTGTNTTVITGDSITQTAGTQTNTSTAAGNTVADGTKSTETTADGQVIKDGAKSNKSTVDNNVIDDGNGNVNTSNATSNTITDGTNTTATTSSSVTVKDNAGNSTVITKDNITTGVGGNKITLDGTAGKATVGASVVDGVNNTFTTGGANAVKLDGVAGTIKTGTVTVTGGTTNDITGLSNTTVTATDFATKGRAATEEQLKAVGEQTWQITADKDATTSGAQTGTKKDAKVGKDDKVQLIAGENMTVNQNERDFTFTLNKDLVKMNSATFLGTGTNKTVITGDSITQTAGTQTNTSTAGGNTVADGTKSIETTAAGQVIKDGTKTNTSTVDENTIVDGTKSNKSTVDGNTITDGTNTTETTSSSVTVKDNAGNSTVITKDNITTGVGANKVTLDGTAGKATIGSSVVDGVNNTFTTGGANAVKLDGAAGTIKTGTVTVTGGTTNDITGLSNTTVTAADFATKGRAATEEQLKAVGEQTWQITADKDATTSGVQTGTKKDAKVGKDDKVQLIAGENMTVNQNERDFTFTLNKDLVKMNSATFEATGGKTTVIKGDSIVQTDGTKVNTSTAGGNTVADGTKSTETTAAGQVIKDGAKSNKSTVDNNVIDDGNGNVNTSNATSNTITDGTNTTATTSSSVTVKDNAGNSTVITKDNITTGVGGNKITLDGTAGKATVGASVVDGVNNTFTTGGANAVKLDGVAGTIKTGTVTVTGGTTNDITGLANTTVNSADFATKGRAATEEQLKAVGEQTWQITADKDATTSGAQTGTKKDAKVGKDDKVQLIAGENMTVNQNERDFTFTLNKDLVKMNSATFLGTGSNTTVITGNSITQTAGTQTNTSTAAGNTIANGTKSTETTADGQVIKDGAKSNKSTVDSNVIDDGNGHVNTSNATSNTITDGTNTSTITAGKANIGNIAVDGVNNKITMGNGATPVTLDGANGHLDGLTNTTWVPGVTKATTGRAATEDQLQQVSDAVGAGWKVNTGIVAGSSGVSNGAASTKVSSGEEVKLQAGDNLVIDQNGKTVSYSLNKDLTKMNSATFEATGGKTTVIKGDSIVQTDGGKTNTSNAAGNTVVDGNKSTATTAAGTTITDGAKTNTSTADKNVIDDGAGNTNVSNATSNTLKNAAGDETKFDAKGVTVKDAAGNNATFTKDGITITKTGKDTVSLTSNGLDNGKNKIVNVAAGVTNTDAVNVGQLKEYAAKSTTELTANNGETAGSTTGNIVLTKTTAADGHTIYDNKLNDKITLGSDPTKAVTVDGTTGMVTGLTNKTWTPGSIVSGRAATEDQLKEAVADSGWKAAVDKEGSGQSTVVGTSPEKIKAEETVTFKAGNNMMVTQTGKSISYAVNPELTNMTSATFKDAAGNTTVTNGNGITITPGSANPTNPHAGPVSLTKDGLNNGNNQIKGVAPGTDPTDAVNVSQLNTSNANTSQAINQIAGEVQHVGAHAAAMAALKPIQYDPLEPTQVMAGVGNYRGETAAALGLAHYTNENTMFNVGVSVGGNHNMVNAGVTHKFGYSPEKKNIPDRYKAGPISSVYVMQDEVSSLKKENAEQKYVIADQAARLTTLEAENEQQRRELAETKKGLDDLKAAVDKLLASKG